MASIKLTELTKTKNNSSSSGYTYIDLHLDMMLQNRGISNNTHYQSINGKDVVVDYDEMAIRNSITNILNTRKGERFLIPTFGCNLVGFIGMPVTPTTGRMIGAEINNAITKFEPRVKIDKINVISNADEHQYTITVSLSIPALKKRDVKLIGVFSDNGVFQPVLE